MLFLSCFRGIFFWPAKKPAWNTWIHSNTRRRTSRGRAEALQAVDAGQCLWQRGKPRERFLRTWQCLWRRKVHRLYQGHKHIFLKNFACELNNQCNPRERTLLSNSFRIPRWKSQTWFNISPLWRQHDVRNRLHVVKSPPIACTRSHKCINLDAKG